MPTLQFLAEIAVLTQRVKDLEAEMERVHKCYQEQIIKQGKELDRFRDNMDTTEAALGISGIYAKLEAEVETWKQTAGHEADGLESWKNEALRIREALEKIRGIRLGTVFFMGTEADNMFRIASLAIGQKEVTDEP